MSSQATRPVALPITPGWKTFVKRYLWPLLPGWPDEGRRIVQGPHLRALLGRAVSLSPAARVSATFNAGAGEGGYSPFLLDLPGVELAVEADFGWRSGGPPRIDRKQVFFCSSLTDIPLAPERFDLILCTEVLEHIADDGKALDELNRILKPGGCLLITVPTPPAVPDSAHVREGYRLADLGGMLKSRSFEVVEARFCMHFFFRSVLKYWPRLPWRPRLAIRTLSYLDRLLPIGPPMDLMVLARKLQRGQSAA